MGEREEEEEEGEEEEESAKEKVGKGREKGSFVVLCFEVGQMRGGDKKVEV